jgi:serine/threonine protein kinase
VLIGPRVLTVHRDISLENVLVDGSGGARLIDMGMCVGVPTPSRAGEGPTILSPQPPAGKASYLSPEVARQEAFDPFAADVWSLGVLLHILLTKAPLYSSPDDYAFRLMASGHVELLLDHYATLGVSLPCPTARDLVAWMCAADPCQRPTVEQVLAHPWVAEEAQRGANASAIRPNARERLCREEARLCRRPEGLEQVSTGGGRGGAWMGA